MTNGSLTGYASLPHSTECSRMWKTPVSSAGGVLNAMEKDLFTSAFASQMCIRDRHKPHHGQVELAGVAARRHEERARERERESDRLLGRVAAARAQAGPAEDKRHAEALHDRGHGRARPMDRLQVGHLRKKDRAERDGEDLEKPRCV